MSQEKVMTSLSPENHKPQKKYQYIDELMRSSSKIIPALYLQSKGAVHTQHAPGGALKEHCGLFHPPSSPHQKESLEASQPTIS